MSSSESSSLISLVVVDRRGGDALVVVDSAVGGSTEGALVMVVDWVVEVATISPNPKSPSSSSSPSWVLSGVNLGRIFLLFGFVGDTAGFGECSPSSSSPSGRVTNLGLNSFSPNPEALSSSWSGLFGVLLNSLCFGLVGDVADFRLCSKRPPASSPSCWMGVAGMLSGINAGLNSLCFGFIGEDGSVFRLCSEVVGEAKVSLTSAAATSSCDGSDNGAFIIAGIEPGNCFSALAFATSDFSIRVAVAASSMISSSNVSSRCAASLSDALA
mmetsp:Transcript_29764/g.54025  ORF Transcript_29764/g.54025 Transcript_29764/m.54025 type:complete len:271 (-) Transcript_29764:166-978(-)